MYRIPAPLLDILLIVELLLDQKARIEPLRVRIVEVDTRDGKVVIQLHIGCKERIRFLF